MMELFIVLVSIAMNAALAVLEVAFVSASNADLSEAVQRDAVARLAECLRACGFPVIGRHEALPSAACIEPSAAAPGIYRRAS